MLSFLRPEDALTVCQTFFDSFQRVLDVVSLFLNPFGFTLLTGREICVAVYDFLNAVLAFLPF